ncbi:MAG: phosphoribosylanthranilate isomerase [Methanomicrobiales archaeon]
MKVKICGLTRIEDVKACETAGSDLIGFINIKRSKRYLKIDQINTLIASIYLNSDIEPVVVLEPENSQVLEEKVEKLNIDNIQLHSLSYDEIKKFKETHKNYKIIKAIGLSNEIDNSKEKEIKEFAEICDGLLMDYEISGRTGGTGIQIPLKVALDASKIARQSNTNVKLFLAGGIDAIRIKKYYDIINKHFDCLDVNSGVEDKPGIKNHDKINEILELII